MKRYVRSKQPSERSRCPEQSNTRRRSYDAIDRMKQWNEQPVESMDGYRITGTTTRRMARGNCPSSQRDEEDDQECRNDLKDPMRCCARQRTTTAVDSSYYGTRAGSYYGTRTTATRVIQRATISRNWISNNKITNNNKWRWVATRCVAFEAYNGTNDPTTYYQPTNRLG